MVARSVRSGRLLSVLIAGLAAAHAQEPVAVARANDDVFTVHCHGGDEALAAQALAAVAPVYRVVAELLGAEKQPPAERIAVHLYVSLADYVAADRERTGGKFAGNQAMTDHGTRSSHVALQPPLSPAALQALGLPRQTALMLAWEAVHAVRMHLCPNFLDHPHWFVDGLAATTALATLAEGHAFDALPMTSQHVVRVLRLREAGTLPTPTAILGDAIDELEMHDRYALRIVFFRFLQAEHSEALVALAGRIRRTGGGKGFAGAIRTAALQGFGDGLAKAFDAWLSAQHPQWEEVFRSAWPRGDEWVQIAFPDRNAMLWSRQSVKGPFRASGELCVLPNDGRQLNFLFGRGAHGFTSVAFVAGHGVTVLEYDASKDAWSTVGKAAIPGLRLEVATPFVVRGEGKSLRVQIAGGEHAFTLTRDLPAEVEWGLGAQAHAGTGTAGVWRSVRVEAVR